MKTLPRITNALLIASLCAAGGFASAQQNASGSDKKLVNPTLILPKKQQPKKAAKPKTDYEISHQLPPIPKEQKQSLLLMDLIKDVPLVKLPEPVNAYNADGTLRHYKQNVYGTSRSKVSNDKIEDIRTHLQWLIPDLPDNQQTTLKAFHKRLGNLKAVPNAYKNPVDDNASAQAATDFQAFLQTAPATQLGSGEKNPFNLPGFQQARLIMLGETHTMHYPAEQMTEYIIDFNRQAPEGKKITHVFVEFSFQVNYAMEFIRKNMDKMPEQVLLKEAVKVGKQAFYNNYALRVLALNPGDNTNLVKLAASVKYASAKGKLEYVESTPREEIRWLRMGYRLLKENPEIEFYAYDIPGTLEQRNSIVHSLAQSVYEQPGTRAVFFTGALHSLKENTSSYMFSGINAENSAANIPGVPKEEVVSVYQLGGQEWTDDNALYGEADAEAEQKANNWDFSNVFLRHFKNQRGNAAVKTPANKTGFDYYLYFDSKRAPAVTGANNW